MKHYLAVLIPHEHDGWRAHFPDFPGCRADGQSVEAAIDAAAAAAAEHARWLRAQGVSLPHPQTYEDVRHHSKGWASERGIDWSRAVLSVVKLPLDALGNQCLCHLHRNVGRGTEGWCVGREINPRH